MKENVISWVIAAVITAAIAFGIIWYVDREALGEGNKIEPETFAYQLSIHGGEYVWHVARKCAVPSKNIREIVYDIEVATGLKSAGNVRQGQFLKIPIYCLEYLTIESNYLEANTLDEQGQLPHSD